MHRRSVLAAMGATGTLGLSGCLDQLLGGTTFVATEATVGDAALEMAGYTHKQSTESEQSRSFAGETVTVVNKITEYERSMGGLEALADTGIFAIFASPEVTVGDRDFNPLDKMSNKEIAQLVQNHYQKVSVGEKTGSRTVRTLGAEAPVTTFEASAEVASGQTVSVFLDIGQVEHGGDHLALIGVYPRGAPGETDRISTLIGGLVHPATNDGSGDNTTATGGNDTSENTTDDGGSNDSGNDSTLGNVSDDDL